ncbi:MAG: magnesium transporter [candidate division WOR-3 bacterium]|nr:magnesium transporter [candidate division WOR-3 bacterium]
MTYNEKIMEEVKYLIEKGDNKTLKEYFSSLEIPDKAYLIAHLSDDEKLLVFSPLGIEEKTELIPELDDYSMEVIIEALDADELSKIANSLDVDEAVDLIAEVEDYRREQVVGKVKRSDQIRALLKFGPDTAAGIMTLKFMSINGKDNVSTAQEELRKVREEEEYKYIYILDDDGRLKGYVTPWKILTSPPEKKLEELAEDIHSVTADLDQEAVANIAGDYDLLQVPVVDNFGHLLGVITIDDLVDVMEEEATEDIQYLGGLGTIETAFYPTRRSFVFRLPWLYINLLTALLAALVVGYFEDVIQAFIGAAIFMPVVAGMGGNAGTQTLSIMVRGLALGEVRYADIKRLLWKEIGVGFLTGFAVGVVTSLIAYFWKGSPLFGVVVGLALILNHIAAGLFGVLIPLILDKVGVDPAHASSIFLTTVTDVFGFFALLGLTKVIMT